MNKKVSVGIFLFLAIPVRADSEMAPYPRVTSSEMGTCYFKQVPNVMETDQVTGNLYEKQSAYGVAYRVEFFGNGTETEVWRTSGWYAFEVFITDTCDYLVRMGNWADGRQPSSEDLAVAFYNKGQLMKEYSTSDLVKDHSSVQSSVSHYIWQTGGNEYPRLVGNYDFHLVTSDEIHYVFDVTTGLIKEQH